MAKLILKVEDPATVPIPDVGSIAIFADLTDNNIPKYKTSDDVIHEFTLISELKRVDNGETETGQVGVEYFSPNQQGGIHGTIYRQYHGAKINLDTITITGITRLVDYGGGFNDANVYRGHSDDGSNHFFIEKSVDTITFRIAGWNHDDGWVDYTK